MIWSSRNQSKKHVSRKGAEAAEKDKILQIEIRSLCFSLRLCGSAALRENILAVFGRI
jgi:hypothetical protein